jgi:hypothetical protein
MRLFGLTIRWPRFRLRWPNIDPFKVIWHEIEEKENITREADDERPWNLGHHPSRSFYGKREPDFEVTRKKFDKTAAKLQ